MRQQASPNNRRSSRVRITMRGRVVFGLFAVGLVTGLVFTLQQPVLALDGDGPNDGVVVGEQALDDLVFEATTSRVPISEPELTLNGEDVTDDARIGDHTLVYEPGPLDDGAYELVLEVPRRFPFGTARERWAFEVDTVPPALDLAEDEVLLEHAEDDIVVEGTVDPDAELTADGEVVDIDEEDGSFRIALSSIPTEPLELEAVNAAGNRTSAEVPIEIEKNAPDEIRSVHVTAYGWVTPSLRDPVIEMIEDGLINTVELDLKDESGDVGYDSDVPLAQEIGAAKGIYDLEEAIEELHDLGVHVQGRIVAFRDPILAEWAWDNDERDMVLQLPSGERYGGYGGFTNFAHDDVRQYNIDIALEAAEAGIDDILYDYVRRPDGPIENLVIPGLEESCDVPGFEDEGCSAEESVVAFVAESENQLAPFGVFHGASVYGIAVDRPTQIAQDIEALAEHTDYIAPMVYPSHWAAGEYDVADPNRQPYEIVHRSVRDFVELVEGTDTRIIPWLQDFSMGGVRYGPDEVRAQIDASADAGAPEWILWSPGVNYTADALVDD
jgi:hypothetical protein